MSESQMIYYPQDEVHTFLLPVTISCSHNACAFCSMYSGEKFSQVPLSRIESELKHGNTYTERVFLTGADPLVIGFQKMEHLLDLIRHYLPYCACVASYASITSISKYSTEELSILHNKGLRELYIGFETGSDEALKLMNKGHTVAAAIREAKRLNQADLSFNTIIVYGIAGKDKSIENALATAEMINKFTTKRIITMSLTIFLGTKLNHMVVRGEFVPASNRERLVEIKTLLENLRPLTPTIFDTTHPTNILKIKGTLPQDRDQLIAEVERRLL
ncbi:MAG: radical SAM protein [Eubacteriales bacterium]|nr:radical SAM protein [Eubacteriales bacterium]